MCIVSGSNMCYFHRCLPLAPQPPSLSNPMLLKAPQTSQAFHFHPLPYWPLPFLPKLPIPLCGPGRAPLTSNSILESLGSLLLRSHHVLRLWRKVKAGNAECSSVRIRLSREQIWKPGRRPAPWVPFNSPRERSWFLFSEPTPKWLCFSYSGAMLKPQTVVNFW